MFSHLQQALSLLQCLRAALASCRLLACEQLQWMHPTLVQSWGLALRSCRPGLTQAQGLGDLHGCTLMTTIIQNSLHAIAEV